MLTPPSRRAREHRGPLWPPMVFGTYPKHAVNGDARCSVVYGYRGELHRSYIHNNHNTCTQICNSKSDPPLNNSVRGSDRAIERSSDRPSDRAPERPRDRAIERSSDRAIEGAMERSSDRAIERSSDRATERPSERATQRPSDRAIEDDHDSGSKLQNFI